MLRTLDLILAPHKLDMVSQAYNLSAQGSRDRNKDHKFKVFQERSRPV